MRWFSIFFLIIILLISGCSKKNSKAFKMDQATPEDILAYANNAYAEGDYDNAFLSYGMIYEQYPTSREYIDATIGLSKCYVEFEEYEKSFDLLYNLLKENLVPSQVPQIYNAIAEFYERSAGISEQLTGEGSTDQKTAISYYQKAINYPNSEDEHAKSYAQYQIGTLYEKLADYEHALEAFQKTADNYPSQQWASLAQEREGIVESKIENAKMTPNESEARIDSLLNTEEEKKGQIIKTEPAKIDTLKKVAPPDTTKPDTTKIVEPPKPEPTPADTTIEKKPKLELD
jgi:tetratricopeptide (TPR) repeat protein